MSPPPGWSTACGRTRRPRRRYATCARTCTGCGRRWTAAATRPTGWFTTAPATTCGSTRTNWTCCGSGVSPTRPAGRRGGDRPEAAADLFDRAVELWGGHPLEDLADPGTELGATVTALREQHREMRTELIDLRLRLGQPARVIPSLRRMVAEEPLDERRQAQLVTALTQEGRVAEALAVYQQARRGIVDELGVDPGPTLQGALQTALDADSAEVRPPSGRPRFPAPGPRRRPARRRARRPCR
nr:AfsR/SARP family transcriptional regulator [Micromonospora provocatoris]